jgi:protein O-GlcNAc transferase
MRLLGGVSGSALWLLEANALVRENLSREAAGQGIDPARLVFAPKLDLPQHLARHVHADLFLDTLPMSARTAASDALWMGAPVLTCAGRSFAGRVAGSLLRAAGLPELVVGSLAEYETAALALARDPALLNRIRETLMQNRRNMPLFDIERYTRDLESAFATMADIAAQGHAPRTFAVAEREEAAPQQPKSRRPEPVAPSPPSPKPQPERAEIAAAPANPGPGRIAYQACPLCESQAIAHLRDADCTGHPLYQPGLPPIIGWNRCSVCSHVFTEGYFTPESANTVFAKSMPHQALGHDVEQQRIVSSRIVERVARHAASGDWLDIGFGNGSLLFTAEEWGFKPVGVDRRWKNVEALTKLGYEAHCLPVEELDFRARFSVISMAGVLETVPYPKVTLKAAHRLLAKGGVLFVSVPNMGSMIWRALDANNANPYWGELEHYHNFSRARLYALLEEFAFKPQSYGVSERYRACMEVIATKR